MRIGTLSITTTSKKESRDFWSFSARYVPRETCRDPALQPFKNAASSPSKNLEKSRFLARGRQCESEVRKRWCCSRQCKCKGEECQVFFAGVVQIFLNWPGLPAPECQTEASPRQYTCKSDACQEIFAGSHKILYNSGSLPRPRRKLKKIGRK